MYNVTNVAMIINQRLNTRTIDITGAFKAADITRKSYVKTESLYDKLLNFLMD